MLTDYSTPDTVRALLGISDLEVEDSQLMLPIYVLTVESGLDNLSTSVLPMYSTVSAIAPDSRTLTQKRFFNTVQLYAATLVAIELLPTLPMAAPRKIGDEKAVVERVNDPYKLLVENLAASLGVLGTRITGALAVLDTSFSATRVARRFVSNVALGFDPVTGV